MDALRTLLGRGVMVPEEDGYWRLVSRLSDSDYLALMIRSTSEPFVQGIRMPGFPPPDIQRMFVGSVDEHALREGYNFYRVVKQCCARYGAAIKPTTRILDFGCGWGRIARFFFKDVRSSNFFGVDVDPDMIALCQDTLPCGTYSVVGAYPPMLFGPESLDAIFAYSVFSHLAEDVALDWIKEFARVLRPGGLVLATTQRRGFLDFCASLHAKGPPFESLWHAALADSFVPVEAARRVYDTGGFLFSPTGGGANRPRSVYGEALIPRSYIQRTYSQFLHLRDWVDNPAELPQALFVLQKLE